MGGLAGVRRGRTAGDLTGGGGRSVEAVRRGGDPRFSRSIFGLHNPRLSREVPAGGWEPPPPGGGYSGGVIPRFQGGGRTMNPRAAGAAGLRRRFPRGAMRLMPGQPGVSEDDPRLQWQEIQGPGGGYSGGVIPRFQSGRTMNPRAGGESAMQRQRRMQWNNNMTGAIPAGWGPYGSPFSANARFPSPPGGWQAGGQFPEPSFPVENQLSDESPWYPDEEVGYEEAAPMQGGFDVFGRGGG